jgi:hypothetical protein
MALRHWKWRRYIPAKDRDLSELQGITALETLLTIVTAVRSTDPTQISYREVIKPVLQY